MTLDEFAVEKLRALEAQQQKRVAVPTRRLPGARVEREGRVLVDFSSNDTLGLAHHPRVLAAAAAAVVDGAGAGGSRLVSGSHPTLHALEQALAQEKQKEAALVCGSGWLANVGVIPALVAEHDTIIIDELAHASLFAGARLARSRVIVAKHNDVDAFAAALREADPARHTLIVTESVFSMDGDRAPTSALQELACAKRAWLLVDDAHGFLVSDERVHADVVTGTLSKAAGSYGGVIAGSRALIDLLFTRARPVLFGTALPPSSIAAAAAAVDVARADDALRARPLQLARRFCERMKLAPPASHIVPLVVGAEADALALMERLIARGVLVVAIRPPTVPAHTSRLRISFSAAHRDDDVELLIEALS